MVAVAHGGRRRTVIIGAALTALVGLVAIAALSFAGGDSKAAYEECQRQTQPTFTAIQELDSHLDVGVVQRDYADEVGDVNAVYDRLVAANPDTPCQPVVATLSKAMELYALASSDWNECIVEAEDCGEGSTQDLWLAADRATTRAKRQLNSLTGGTNATETAEKEATQTEADALAMEEIRLAQVAMETYATDHQGSYEGATSRKLREIEPSLPANLEVTDTAPEYFAISITSGANWFVMENQWGELVRVCGDRGTGGCPQSGEWE